MAPSSERHASVLPYFLARIATLSVDEIEALRAPRTVAAIAAAAALERRAADARDAASAALHAAIGAIVDRPMRNRLLELRRDLFTGKRVSEARMALVSTLDSDSKDAVAALCRLTETHALARDAIQGLYAAERANARRRIGRLLDDQSFRNGLALSSAALARNAERYLRADPDRFDSRDEQIERGLVRYLARAAMKATPFATFCAVVPGTLHALAGSPNVLALEGSPRALKTVVRLNKRIHGVLWRALERRDAVRRSLRVAVNPTLDSRLRDGCAASGSAARDWTFLTPARPANDIHVLSYTALRARIIDRVHATAMTLDELIRDVAGAAHSAEEDVATERNDVASEITRLIDIDCLRLLDPVADQDTDWDVSLGDWLSTVDDAVAATVHGLLGALRALTATYAAASIGERAALVETLRATLRQGVQALAVDAPVSVLELPIYEDATAAATLSVDTGPNVRAALDAMTEWLSSTHALSAASARQAELRHFFDTQYGGTSRSVGLLEFYHDFRRAHLDHHEEMERQFSDGRRRWVEDDYDIGNPLGLDVVRALDAATRRVEALFAARWRAAPDAVEVGIDRAELAAALVDLPKPPPSCMSTSVFCQLVADGSTARVISVKDHTVTGCGKFYGRFLNLAPNDFTDALRTDNATLAGANGRLAELRAAVRVNADLRPRLGNAEIAYEGSVDGAIGLADIDVAPSDRDPYALELRQRSSGLRLFVADLGVVNSRARPPLFRLLTSFSPGRDVYFPIPDSRAVSDGLPERISHRPRFVYAERFVLSRRRWTIPAACFPRKVAGETPHGYFARIQAWHAEHRIDVEVFATVRYDAVRAGHTARHDSWKPQFIDFTSPHLVELFARLPGDNAAFEVELQERYPARDMLPTNDGQRFAFELVLQVNRPA